MQSFEIITREEYELCRAHGIEPLTDRRFPLEHGLRVEIQREMFGKGHTPEENERFYRWCWNNNLHVCSECMRPLREYSAIYVSHILTRGAHSDMAHDPRNVNILCFEHHSQWENGERESMRIYRMNQLTIGQLKKEYNIKENLK